MFNAAKTRGQPGVESPQVGAGFPSVGLLIDNYNLTLGLSVFVLPVFGISNGAE